MFLHREWISAPIFVQFRVKGFGEEKGSLLFALFRELFLDHSSFSPRQ